MPDTPHPETWNRETRAIRAGREHNGTALAPTLWATSTFFAHSIDDARAMASDVTNPNFYGRHSNPTVADFEGAIADLEGAESARAFASGMAAISSVILAICSSGDHVVTQRQMYSHTALFFQAVCPRFGIDVTFVDGTEPGAFARAVEPGRTTLVLAETPANPKLALVDLDEIGAIKGPVTVVDSTFATPMGQRPLEFGVDLVVHSATKAIAGHNDAILGVVCGSDELITWIRGFSVLQGSVASPHDALNGLRGLRTLPVRFQRQAQTAAAVSDLLADHDAVDDVFYPGHPSHPQHELASRQLDSFGGVLAFDLAGGLDAGRKLVEHLELVQLATSLGGPETLVTHPASTTHTGLLPEELEAAGIGPGTVRLSCGLEDTADVVSDLRRALDSIS